MIMDYEKEYKAALERAKEFMSVRGVSPYEDALECVKELSETIFPQLAESKDEKIRKGIYNFLYNERHNIKQLTPYTDEFDRWLAWLEKQWQQQCDYNPYKEVVESIAKMCEKYKSPTSDLSDFLDNVKVKCKDAKEYDSLFPQTAWKPSDEQIMVLAKASETYCGIDKGVLYSLYNDLKKLKEE